MAVNLLINGTAITNIDNFQTTHKQASLPDITQLTDEIPSSVDKRTSKHDLISTLEQPTPAEKTLKHISEHNLEFKPTSTKRFCSENDRILSNDPTNYEVKLPDCVFDTLFHSVEVPSTLPFTTPTGSKQELEKEQHDGYDEITSEELASLLTKNESVLLIDCRSFIDFNANHIHNAVNINCTNRITKKRLADGKVSVAEAITGPEGKEQYRKAEEDVVIVVYDENSESVECLQKVHPIKLVIDCLHKTDKQSKFLKGGLQRFHEQHPGMCTLRDTSNVPLLFSPTSPDINCDIDSAEASEICSHIFIGNHRDASNRECLKQLGITHIINCTSHLPLHFEDDGIIYKKLPANDSGCQNLKQYFRDAIEFIDEVSECGGKVLVHCQAGVSRSPTIVLAYLMARTEHKMLSDAFNFLKDRRPIVAPNLNFMGQLLEFEQTGVPREGLCPPLQPVHLLKM